MSVMKKFSSAVIAAGMLAASLAGCSGGDGLPREPVSGSVDFDGKPLDKGSITFLPAEAELPTQGGADVMAGKYAIPRDQGLVPGKYRVVITSAGGDSEKSKDTTNGMPGMSAPLPKELLPAQYNTKSTLTAEVKAGDANLFEFDLKKSTLKN